MSSPPAYTSTHGEQPNSSGAIGASVHHGASQQMASGSQGMDGTTGSDEQVPPPAYGDTYGHVVEERDGLGTDASVNADGRVNIRINQKTSRLSTLLVPALRNQLDLAADDEEPPPYVPPSLARPTSGRAVPSLNIVIHVVGSRGDVQPFVALGKVLKEQHGHRVRLATHPVFKSFVEENGLEFFNILGDPSELMAFMVKNPGLMPGFDSLRSGDVGRRRKEIGKMIQRCWRSCIEAGDGSEAEANDERMDDWAGSGQASATALNKKPFVADAIIANPPSFAHIHCAEKLGIPLHMMFTMPWSPTLAFPHPLANIQSSNADANMTNFLSYALVDLMTWQGLGDIINRFRVKGLGLEPIELTWAPAMLARLKVPWTYCWSPALIPKPRCWGPHITISGFYFLNLASNYTPEPDLAAFLEAGPPPVYIGFGSIVVDDPNAMTKLIFEAVEKSGQRALVSKGWGGFGADQIGIPEGVFMLGNVPHDWLFKHVSCVVHHGGAGTTAAGISAGKPTVIVPFFGDQPFWGAMVAKAGAGPKPIPYKNLTSSALAESIGHALKPESLEKAKELSEKISQETGSATGAGMFHEALDVDKLRCQISPNRAAVWRYKNKKMKLRLSAFAATHLANEKMIDFNHLKLYRPREYDTEMGPTDPISGGASALIATMGSMTMGIADLPVSALKVLNIHPDAKKKKKLEEGRRSSQASSETEASKQGKQPTSSNASIESFPQEPQAASSSPSSSRSSSPPPSVSSAAIAREAATHFNADTPLTSTSSLPQDDTQPTEPQRPPLFRPQTPPSADPASRINSHASSNTQKSKPSSSDPQAILNDSLGTASSVGRIVSAGFKSPMDFTHALARGFHNAPKLYNDTTVRPAEKVTDFSSGLRAAGKGFGFGMYDGISGLVTQPFEGAKKEGGAGFIKGFGKGIGGVVLKPGAAIFGLPGYVARGAYKEVLKRMGPGIENYVVSARVAQGLADINESSDIEKRVVCQTYAEMHRFLKNDKKIDEEMVEAIRARVWREAHGGREENLSRSATGFAPAYETVGGANASHSTTRNAYATSASAAPLISSRFGAQADNITLTETDEDAQIKHPPQPSSQPPPPPQTHHQHPDQTSQPDPQSYEEEDEGYNHDLETAIRASVLDTSRGDPEEDAMIERAIRASVQKLEQARARRTGKGRAAQHDLDEEAGEGPSGSRDMDTAAAEGERQDETHDGEEGDEEAHARHEEEVKKAMEVSKRQHEQSEEDRLEEETVMRYVLKQSKAEAEMRKAHAGAGKARAGEGGEGEAQREEEGEEKEEKEEA